MNRVETIHVATTTDRKTEPGRFEAALRGAAEGLARSVVAGVEVAAPLVPGGTFLSAAVHGAVAGPSGGGLACGGLLPGGGSAAALASGGPDAGAPVGGGVAGAVQAAGAGGGDSLLEATRRLQEEARTFNLQYLQLQENMQRESREFTAVSNVMKAKHDTARAAIQNIH